MAREIEIAGRKIGPGHPAFIVAELSCNHLQDYRLAIETIEAMRKAGADAVKIQTYTPDTITLDSDSEDFVLKQGSIWDGTRFHTLYQEGFTPWEWTANLKKEVEERGMIFFSSPFDKTAVDHLEEVGVPVYKIASFEITDIPLIKYAASKGKPIIISTGVSELGDLEKAVEACRSVGNDQIALLKCTSAYPAPYEDANLRTIPDLAKRFDVVSGLSDHTHGIAVPIAAVSLGASIIEKHFIIDRDIQYSKKRFPDGKYSNDREFSLEPVEFKEMVKNVRRAERALGEINYDLKGASKNSREFARSLYIAEDMVAGEIYTEKNVRSVRPGFGMHPERLPEILGKRATRDVKKGERMSEGMF